MQLAPNLTIDGMAVIQDSHGNNANWSYPTYVATGARYQTGYLGLQPQRDRLRIYARWRTGISARSR